MPKYKITNPATGQVLRVTGTRPPTEDELTAIFSATTPQAANIAADRAAGDKAAATEQIRLQDEARQSADTAQEAIAGGAGMVGGAMGGAPLAGLFQAGASGLMTAARHAKEIPGAIADVSRNLASAEPGVAEATKRGMVEGAGEGALSAAKEGAVGAGAQFVGEAASKALKPTSTWIAKQALAATDALKKEFPTLSESLIKHSVDVSSGGLGKARALLSQYKNAANRALQLGDKAGVGFDLAEVADVLQNTIAAKVANSADIPGAQKVVNDVLRKLSKGRQGMLSATELDALKTDMQARASAVYKALQNSQRPSYDKLRAEVYQQLAQQANQLLESKLANAGIQGYKAANSSAQELIGLTRAIRRQVNRVGGNVLSQALSAPTTVEKIVRGAFVPTAFVSPTTAAVLAAERMVTAPANLSRLARAGASRGAALATRYLPASMTGTIRSLITD